MKNIAIYPGTFDPPTNGHVDVIERAARLFGKVIIAVADGEGKNPLFTIEERREMLLKITSCMKNVEVDSFDELLVDYVKRKNANVIVRGLRALSDFEYEFQMALTNRVLDESLETVFMMTSEKYSYVSSSLIREISVLGGDLKKFVPPVVNKAIREKLSA